MSFLDLLNEHIFLVQEKYNGGGGEITVVADTVEQVQTFVHSILKEKCEEPFKLTTHGLSKKR